LIFVKVAACAMRGKNQRLMMVFGLPFATKLIEIIQFTHDLRSRWRGGDSLHPLQPSHLRCYGSASLVREGCRAEVAKQRRRAGRLRGFGWQASARDGGPKTRQNRPSSPLHWRPV